MNISEIKEKHNGQELLAIIDEDGLNLFAGNHQIDWPDDWPDEVSSEFVKESGFELLSVD